MLFYHHFFCTVIFAVTPIVVPSQEEMTLEELIVAHEKSFANLRSLDITYASGHVTLWDGWRPKPNADIHNLQPTRWRKSGDVERKDRAEYVGDVPVFDGNNRRDANTPSTIQGVSVPQHAEYTDGSKLWRFSGDPNRTEHIGLLEPGKGFGEIRPIPHHAILLGFPYYTFCLSLSIDNQIYSIAQVLRKFRTEIVDRKQTGNGLIITTRSYLPSVRNDPRRFIQISFDSSVGYFPRQIVVPFSADLGETDDVARIPYYGVRDFIEYHPSGDGAFFPVKMIRSQTDDINKLEDLEPIGKTAALSIVLNQPVDVPAIEFPPGAIVVVEEAGEFISYIWGEQNEPLKVLTQEDYEEAARNRQANLPPREGISPLRIGLTILGMMLVAVAIWRLYAKDTKACR